MIPIVPFALEAIHAQTGGTGGGGGGGSGSLVVIDQKYGTGAAGAITFDNIPQGYTHLVIFGYGNDVSSSVSNADTHLKINNDSTTGNYTNADYHGYSSSGGIFSGNASPTSDGVFMAQLPGTSGDANAIGQVTIHINNYANANKHKIIDAHLTDKLNGNVETLKTAAVYKSNSPVTRIDVKSGGSGYSTDTVWTLCGIGGGGGGSGAMVKIGQVVCAGSQTVVTFSSIPATYTDLKLIVNCRGDSSTGSTTARLKINSDTNSSNYPNPQRHYAYNGGSYGADSQSSNSSGGYIFDVTGTASVSHPLTTAIIHIPAYSSTVLEKAVMVEFYGASSGGQEVIKVAFNYIATPAAVSQIDITIGAGAFLNGSVFTLYGLG